MTIMCFSGRGVLRFAPFIPFLYQFDYQFEFFTRKSTPVDSSIDDKIEHHSFKHSSKNTRTSTRGVLDSVNFGCFEPSRFSHFVVMLREQQVWCVHKLTQNKLNRAHPRGKRNKINKKTEDFGCRLMLIIIY